MASGNANVIVGQDQPGAQVSKKPYGAPRFFETNGVTREIAGNIVIKQRATQPGKPLAGKVQTGPIA